MCPPEEYFTAFFKWIGARYGDWELPLAFFLLKSVCGCRLKDICSLEADQWDGERIHFRGDQTKNRAPRNFLVPKEVATAMTKVKGNVHLWDRYPEGIKSYLIKNKMKASRVAAEFSPQTFISFVASVMKRWQAENPSKTLSTHDFRKRAVTVNYEKGMSISEIADTFGMSEQNVTKSYLDKKRKKVPDHLFQKAGAALMPSL